MHPLPYLGRRWFTILGLILTTQLYLCLMMIMPIVKLIKTIRCPWIFSFNYGWRTLFAFTHGLIYICRSRRKPLETLNENTYNKRVCSYVHKEVFVCDSDMAWFFEYCLEFKTFVIPFPHIDEPVQVLFTLASDCLWRRSLIEEKQSFFEYHNITAWPMFNTSPQLINLEFFSTDFNSVFQIVNPCKHPLKYHCYISGFLYWR